MTLMGDTKRTEVNGEELRITGMSRSGNHAIIGWILRQATGRVCFLNCAEPKTNPFDSARCMEDGRSYWVNYEPFDVDRERSGAFTPKDLLLYSHEDCFLGMVHSPEFEADHDRYVGPSAHRRDVLILRDPFNLFASRLRAGYSMISDRTAVRVWKQHAREALGRRRYLQHGRLPILYNRWVLDRPYRRTVADELGLRFTDAGFQEVARTGAGSSFDGLRYDGRASRMRVFERWKAYAEESRYLAMIDAEVIELSEALFGHIPGTETLVSRRSA